MPTIKTTHVCKSGPHKGKMLAVLLDDEGNPVIRTDTPATGEEIVSAWRPVLKLFTKPPHQEVKP